MSNLPPLTVHHLHISQSERIVFLCEELQVPYTLRLYTRNPIFSPPDLASLTPQKSAPVITTNNLVTGVEFNMSESGAIAEYVNTVYGGGKLSLPPTHANYPDYVFWFHYANASLGPSFFRKSSARLTDPEGTSPLTTPFVNAAKKHLGALEAQLAKTGAYIVGDDFTLADVMCVWSLTTGRQWNPTDLTEYPAVLAYLQRIGQRDGYRRAMENGEADVDWRQGLTAQGPPVFAPYKAVLEKMGVDATKL